MAKPIELHPHARERAGERGASESEIAATVRDGERIPAKFGRSAFRRNFIFGGMWRGKQYATKQVEVIAVEENQRWLVITILVKYF
jgi:Domain of unknown function (DUF4258)